MELNVIEKLDILDATAYQYFHNLIDRRTVILNSDIDENIIETVYLPLKEFEEDDNYDPVTLIINTVGGSIADGLILCNVIDDYKKDLNIIVPSYACSMGTIILCAGNKNPHITKNCYPFSFALFHSGQTFLSGESTSVEDVMGFNKSVDQTIRSYVLEHTNIPAELYDAHERKQWYLTADDMLKYGLVHHIIGRDK